MEKTIQRRRDAETQGRSLRLRASAPLRFILFSVFLTLGCDRVQTAAVGASTIEPDQLRGELAGALVVDVRSREEFEREHLPGSVHVPPAELHGYFHQQHLKGDRAVVLVGERQLRASLALPSARREGFDQAFVLAGGIQRWRREGLPLQPGPAPEPSEPRTPPSQALTLAQQLVALSSGTLIKPTYMLLSLVLAWFLRRGKTPALRLLFHGSLWFFVGEAFCAVDYYVHGHGFVDPFDLLHGAGMVVMSALVPWGLFKLFDDRVLHFSDPERPCAVQRLCVHCWKREPVRCGPHDLMSLLVGGLAILSLMPLSLDPQPSQHVSQVFGFAVDYGSPIINQLVELRAYPLLAVLLFAITFGMLWGGKRSVRRAEPWFFAGFGFMAFSLFRFLLFSTWRDALYWSDFWEETTELLVVAAIGLLAIVFRRQLGLVPTPEPAPAAPAPSPETR